MNLKDLGDEGLRGLLRDMGQPAFRAKQLHGWLYGKFATSYDEMTNLPSGLRSALAERVRPFALDVVRRLEDSRDGTVKWLSSLEDGNSIETVLIRVPGRSTVCVSTQVGCPVRCVFCASGRGGLVRDLTPGEIIDQVVLACRELGERVDNIVVMGMGEPLLNLDSLAAALDAISSEETLGFGARASQSRRAESSPESSGLPNCAVHGILPFRCMRSPTRCARRSSPRRTATPLRRFSVPASIIASSRAVC